MEFERIRRNRPELRIIPLVDVAMFMLIFFMVAGTIEKFELIPISPPEAESGKFVDEGHIMILLGSRDELVVDDELMDIDRMEQVVRERLTANPNKIISVKADATIPAVRMIQVMDRIKLAGGKNLSVMTHSHRMRSNGTGN